MECSSGSFVDGEPFKTGWFEWVECPSKQAGSSGWDVPPGSFMDGGPSRLAGLSGWDVPQGHSWMECPSRQAGSSGWSILRVSLYGPPTHHKATVIHATGFYISSISVTCPAAGQYRGGRRNNILGNRRI